MTKPNNKGFNLIDVVIAVAILSLLVTPILFQVIQSLNTSAQGKEKQYVIDNAEYVLGYFQSTSNDLLTTTSTDVFKASDNGSINVNSISTRDDLDCELYQIGGSGLEKVMEGTNPVKVKYEASVYVLDDAKLGRDKTAYSRNVIVDNLSNSIMSHNGDDDSVTAVRYEIDYSFDSDNPPSVADSSTGWIVQNDGSMVRVDSLGRVTSIVVRQRDIYKYDTAVPGGTPEEHSVTYVDPNSIDIAYIQNLDINTVAIIQGNAANFDKQAESDFFAMKFDELKNDPVRKAQYEQAISSLTGETGLNQADSTYKNTKISIKKTDTDKYEVDCTVYYFEAYKLSANEGFTTNLTEDDIANGYRRVDNEHTSLRWMHKPLVQSYNVFHKTFYTKSAPDIYFVYEPYVTNSSGNASQMRYADTDFISVYTDDACKDSKLYLIKPTLDQLTVKNGGSPYATPNYDSFYTYNQAGELVPVKIELLWLKHGSATHPLKVYTNIRTEEKNGSPTSYDANFNPYTSVYGGYKIINVIKEVDGNVDMVPETGDTNTYVQASIEAYPGNPRNNKLEDNDYILPLSEDVVRSGRLYTVSVTLTEKNNDSNVIRFTGAKEVN